MFVDTILTFLLGLSCILVGMSLASEQLITYFSKQKAISEMKGFSKLVSGISAFLSKAAPLLGIFAVVIGFITFVSPAADLEQTGDKVIYHTTRFLGDLIPSLLSIMGGFMVNRNVLDIFNISKDKVDQVELKLNKYRVIIGLITLIFGFLHWVIGSRILF